MPATPARESPDADGRGEPVIARCPPGIFAFGQTVRRRSARAPSGAEIVVDRDCQICQGGNITHQQRAPPPGQKPSPFPACQSTGDGEECRPSQCSEILLRQRKIDSDAGCFLPACLVDESQKRVGDASRHVEGRDLDETALCLAQLLFEELGEAGQDRRNLVNKAPPDLCRPNDEHGTPQCFGGSAISARTKAPSKFEKFTWMGDPQNHRITSPASLRQFEPSRQDKAEIGCRFTVAEDSFVGAQRPEGRCVRERAPFFNGQARKYRNAAKKIWVDAHGRLDRFADRFADQNG